MKWIDRFVFAVDIATIPFIVFTVVAISVSQDQEIIERNLLFTLIIFSIGLGARLIERLMVSTTYEE